MGVPPQIRSDGQQPGSRRATDPSGTARSIRAWGTRVPERRVGTRGHQSSFPPSFPAAAPPVATQSLGNWTLSSRARCTQNAVGPKTILSISRHNKRIRAEVKANHEQIYNPSPQAGAEALARHPRSHRPLRHRRHSDILVPPLTFTSSYIFPRFITSRAICLARFTSLPSRACVLQHSFNQDFARAPACLELGFAQLLNQVLQPPAPQRPTSGATRTEEPHRC